MTNDEDDIDSSLNPKVIILNLIIKFTLIKFSLRISMC
jgi:hypothetical protein